jgi:hypothetical protein
LRFLTDYHSGDTYFKVHREGHNLDRCRTQFKLVESIEQQEEARIDWWTACDMRILFTSGAGFTGSHVVEHFQGKAEVCPRQSVLQLLWQPRQVLECVIGLPVERSPGRR